jgi:hypothetical protein
MAIELMFNVAFPVLDKIAANAAEVLPVVVEGNFRDGVKET